MLSVVLAALGVACTANKAAVPGVAAAGPAPAASAPPAASAAPRAGVASAAQRVYVDPRTGAFIEPPAEDTAAKVATTATGTVKSWTTPAGVTLVKIPSAVQSVCATRSPTKGPASEVTVADCQPAKAGQP